MHPDRERRLLTAYVDGELSPRQLRHVERLLARSEPARRLLRQLQADSRALRDLPTVRPPTDLAPAILGAIAPRRAQPRVAPRPAVSAGLSAWVGVAAAAAVLLGLGLASYLYFASWVEREPGSADAARRNLPPQPDQPKESGPLLARTDRPGTRNDADLERSRDRLPPSPPPAKASSGVAERSRPSAPADSPDDKVLTDRVDIFRIARIDVDLPVTFKLDALVEGTVRKAFLAELAAGRDFRLELPCRNGTRAFEHLRGGIQSLGIAPVFDPAAREHLRLPQLPGSYLVYLEDVTPEELARLLTVSAEADRKGGRAPLDRQFDRLVLARMTAADHKELAALAGTDPAQADHPRAPAAADGRRPLPDLTARQVEKSLAGQGGAVRPRPGEAPGSRPALVLSSSPPRPRAGSADVQRYLQMRKPARPGTLRVLLVLRG
jgi:hypothetical protein